jgi:hypothetical protein
VQCNASPGARNQKRHDLQKNEPSANGAASHASARLIAHLDTSIRRLHSYLQYMGTVKYWKPMEALQRLREINLEWLNLVNLYHAFTPILPWQFLPIPYQHCKNRPHFADLATSPKHICLHHMYNIMNMELRHIPCKNLQYRSTDFPTALKRYRRK